VLYDTAGLTLAVRHRAWRNENCLRVRFFVVVLSSFPHDTNRARPTSVARPLPTVGPRVLLYCILTRFRIDGFSIERVAERAWSCASFFTVFSCLFVIEVLSHDGSSPFERCGWGDENTVAPRVSSVPTADWRDDARRWPVPPSSRSSGPIADAVTSGNTVRRTRAHEIVASGVPPSVGPGGRAVVTRTAVRRRACYRGTNFRTIIVVAVEDCCRTAHG